MKHTSPFLLLLILFFSCTQSPNDNVIRYKDFPETVNLTSTVIEIDTALFRYPYRIRIDNDRAIIMDLHNADYFFHLFEYPGFSYKSSFGKRGQAPEETLSAENFRIHANQVYTLDANKRELKTYTYNNNRDSLIQQHSLTLDEALLRPLDFTQYDDTTLLIPDYSGHHRFLWVNSRGTINSQTGGIPTTNREALKSSKPALAQAWRSFFDYNPRNQHLAVVTQLGEVVEIYNLKYNTHKVIMGPNGEPEFQVSDNYAIPSGIMGFSDLQITDNLVYAVFHGRTFDEIMKQKEPIDGGQYIYTFDLQGNPIRKYILDRYINGIYVDEAHGVIWATDVNSNQPIMKFNMSE